MVTMDYPDGGRVFLDESPNYHFKVHPNLKTSEEPRKNSKIRYWLVKVDAVHIYVLS